MLYNLQLFNIIIKSHSLRKSINLYVGNHTIYAYSLTNYADYEVIKFGYSLPSAHPSPLGRSEYDETMIPMTHEDFRLDIVDKIMQDLRSVSIIHI